MPTAIGVKTIRRKEPAPALLRVLKNHYTVQVSSTPLLLHCSHFTSEVSGESFHRIGSAAKQGRTLQNGHEVCAGAFIHEVLNHLIVSLATFQTLRWRIAVEGNAAK
ncbi:hypothetical protein D3C78_1487500 [compost metagenome]